MPEHWSFVICAERYECLNECFCTNVVLNKSLVQPMLYKWFSVIVNNNINTGSRNRLWCLCQQLTTSGEADLSTAILVEVLLYNMITHSMVILIICYV